MKAVIYCRVSSKKQISEGNGLETQESLCKQYAQKQGYEIVKIYKDPGISGKSMSNRPQMQAMKEYLKKAKEPHVVIIEKLDRLARNLKDSVDFINLLKEQHHLLSNCNHIIPINHPEGRFSISVQSAMSQLQREQIADRSTANMRDLLQQGYWVFTPPTGYFYNKDKSSDKHKWLLRAEPQASIIQNALLKFSTGELDTQTDVANFLEREFKSANISLPSNKMDFVKRILTEKKIQWLL